MGKDVAARIWAKQALEKLCRKTGDAQSAGQVAKEMGISRNTAAKRLSELKDLGMIERVMGYRGNVPLMRYYSEGKKQ